MASSFPRMHVSLYVSNLAATVNFYNTFFGQSADKIESGYAKYVLDSPSLIISFLENPQRVESNFGHLGFQVDSEEELARRLELAREKNLVSKEEVGTACCYAVQDKFWVNDPDGHQWEVYYFHSDSSFNDPKYQQEDASACCQPAELQGVIQQSASAQKVVSEQSSNACEPGSGCC